MKVRNLFSSQHRCLWPVYAQAKISDHKVDVVFLDFDAQHVPRPLKHIYQYPQLKSTLKSRPSEICTRFVLVEDLSPAMIEALGSELDLDPEFFSNHIAGAEEEYVKPGKTRLEDGRRNAHPTAFLEPKDYFSITWKRKALQEVQGQATLKDVLRVKGMQEGETKAMMLDELFSDGSLPDCNIWRGNEIMGNEYQPGIAVAAEERVSIYFKNDPEDADLLTGKPLSL